MRIFYDSVCITQKASISQKLIGPQKKKKKEKKWKFDKVFQLDFFKVL